MSQFSIRAGRVRLFNNRLGIILENFMVARFSILLACLFAMLVIVDARAVDISDKINGALKSYEKHALATPAAALDAATNLLRQQQGEAWKVMLPEPLSGWTAADAESTT